MTSAQHYKVGQVYAVSDHDWIMLVHIGYNKVVAICTAGNRYRNPYVVCNRHYITHEEYTNINSMEPICRGTLALRISDDNVNYPKPIDHYYISSGVVSCGIVLINSGGAIFIVAQVNPSVYGLVDSSGELLVELVTVDDGTNISRRELFQMGATADMYVVGKSYKVLTFSKTEDMSDAERSEEWVL